MSSDDQNNSNGQGSGEHHGRRVVVRDGAIIHLGANKSTKTQDKKNVPNPNKPQVLTIIDNDQSKATHKVTDHQGTSEEIVDSADALYDAVGAPLQGQGRDAARLNEHDQIDPNAVTAELIMAQKAKQQAKKDAEERTRPKHGPPDQGPGPRGHNPRDPFSKEPRKR
jgi:hypothetical protein